MRGLSFEAPMRPLDVQRDMYLDYTNSQAIKFYNKGCETFLARRPADSQFKNFIFLPNIIKNDTQDITTSGSFPAIKRR